MSITSTRGLTPRGRKTVASLGRLATAVRTPGAHASAIKTDTDPLAGKRAIGGDGQTQGGLQCGIAQTGARLSGGRGDTHQARHITGQAAPAEHLGGFEIAGGLYHVQGDLRAAGRAHTIGNPQGLKDWIATCTTAPALAPSTPAPTLTRLAQIGRLYDDASPPQEQYAGRTQALVHQGHRMLPLRLGHSLPHKVLVLVGTGQLDQQNLIGDLRCGCRQPLFKL